MTITEFLLARIAEDERRASSPDAAWAMHWPECDFPGDVPGYCTCDLTARVLAECEAKRELVSIATDQIRLGREARGWDNWGDMANQMLSTMAKVYADHPDYDPVWALDG